MPTAGRNRISDIIDVKALERENRDILYFGIFIAICFHSLLVFFFSQEPYYDETVTFVEIELAVKRPPLKKPFTVLTPKTRTRRPFQRIYPSGMPSGFPETRKMTAPDTPIPNYSPLTERDISRYSGMHADQKEIPEEIGPDKSVTIPPDSRLLTDPGPYGEDILIDPYNKNAIQGFVHIPVVKFAEMPHSDNTIRAVKALCRSVSRFTNITAITDKLPEVPVPVNPINPVNPMRPLKPLIHTGLPASMLVEMMPPIVYVIADTPFELTPVEAEALARYLDRGGMLFIENGRPGNGNMRESLKAFWAKRCGATPPVDFRDRRNRSLPYPQTTGYFTAFSISTRAHLKERGRISAASTTKRHRISKASGKTGDSALYIRTGAMGSCGRRIAETPAKSKWVSILSCTRSFSVRDTI